MARWWRRDARNKRRVEGFVPLCDDTKFGAAAAKGGDDEHQNLQASIPNFRVPLVLPGNDANPVPDQECTRETPDM